MQQTRQDFWFARKQSQVLIGTVMLAMSIHGRHEDGRGGKYLNIPAHIPLNLHTSPSLANRLDKSPPPAARSITYSHFQATKCPLSIIYFSPGCSYKGLG